MDPTWTQALEVEVWEARLQPATFSGSRSLAVYIYGPDIPPPRLLFFANILYIFIL